MLTDRTILFHLAAIELIGDLISLNSGILFEYQLQLLEHLICSMVFKPTLKSRFQAVKHGTLNYRVVISFALPDVHNIWCCSSSRPGTQRCIQDVTLLCSNEDNPQVTDPVHVIATIIFHLCFLKERIKIQRNNSTSHLSPININKQDTIRD